MLIRCEAFTRRRGFEASRSTKQGGYNYSRPFLFYPRTHMTQKLIAQQLIKVTLYKKQDWKPVGFFQKGHFLLTQANTLWGAQVITIDYEHNMVYCDGRRMRLPKSLSKDLITLVQLKITKIIKHYVSSH